MRVNTIILHIAIKCLYLSDNYSLPFLTSVVIDGHVIIWWWLCHTETLVSSAVLEGFESRQQATVNLESHLKFLLP